jgi:hypothetical protein
VEHNTRVLICGMKGPERQQEGGGNGQAESVMNDLISCHGHEQRANVYGQGADAWSKRTAKTTPMLILKYVRGSQRNPLLRSLERNSREDVSSEVYEW